MGGLKAPSPDGFQGIFFHSFWNIIMDEVNGLVCDLVNGRASPKSINSTFIVLIPKVPNPENVSQFRPISLCNYSYKIVSKVLANRLKPLLPIIISPSQSAFVVGRQIQDNVLITHEVFHFLKMRKGLFKLALKIDMNKAYDRVEWGFLAAIMIRMGFDSNWINLIKTRGSDFAIPLPLIHSATESGYLEGVKLSMHGPVLSHLLFADDTLIFLKASSMNCQNIVHILDAYCHASRQELSLNKSSAFFSDNTPACVCDELQLLLRMPSVAPN
ncbi:hypothetical protein TB2_035686 [Malus domestica]